MLKIEQMAAIEKFRDDNEINPFEYGETKDAQGWFPTTVYGEVID